MCHLMIKKQTVSHATSFPHVKEIPHQGLGKYSCCLETHLPGRLRGHSATKAGTTRV